MEAQTQPAPAVSGRDLALWSMLVFVVALGLRGVALWELSSEIAFGVKLGDGRVYHLWAQGIAAGDWIGDRVFYQAPLYPYFLAVIYKIAGESQMLLLLVQIMLGAIGCALLTQAGWRLVSKPTGILAGLGLALYPVAIFADLSLQKSVLDLFFVCAMLAILSEIIVRETPRHVSFIGLGLVLGALVLTRENALVFVLVLAGWMLAQSSRSWRTRVAWVGLFAIGLTVVLLPVAVRNWSVSGDFHLTTSQFGHNFFIGNNPNADGTYAPLVYARGEPLVERDDAVAIVARAVGHDPSPSEVSDFYTDRALEYIQSEPLGWISLLGRKAMLLLNRVELVDTQGHYAFLDDAVVLRSTDGWLHFGVLVPLAFLGVWISWPARRRLWPVYLLVASYAGSLLLFYIFSRYRLPLLPMLLLFAGAALGGLREFVSSRSKRDWGVGLAVLVAGAVLANWPLLDRRYMESVTRYNLGNELADLGLERDAIASYEAAIELHADNALANHNLGVMLAREKKLGVAQRYFERAIEIEPDYAEAHFNLARVLRDSYEREAAVESYRRGLEIDPDRPEIQVELGRLLLDLGRPGAARQSFARALQLDPNNQEARWSLSQMGGR